MRGVWQILAALVAVTWMAAVGLSAQAKVGGDPKAAAVKNPVPSNAAVDHQGTRGVQQVVPALPRPARPGRRPAGAQGSQAGRPDRRRVEVRRQRRRDLHHHRQRRRRRLRDEGRPQRSDGDRHVAHRQLHPQHRSQEVGQDPPVKSVGSLFSVCAAAWLAAVGCGYIDTTTPPPPLAGPGLPGRIARRADHRPADLRRRARRLPGAAAGTRPADRVSAQHPRRQADRLHRVLPRKRDHGPGGGPAQRAHLHDLPQLHRHRPAAHQADHADAR